MTTVHSPYCRFTYQCAAPKITIKRRYPQSIPRIAAGAVYTPVVLRTTSAGIPMILTIATNVYVAWFLPAPVVVRIRR
jgi:ABC-type sulfate transport system permease component